MFMCRHGSHGQEAPENTEKVIELTDHIYFFPIACNIYSVLNSLLKSFKHLLTHGILWLQNFLVPNASGSKVRFLSGIQRTEVAGLNGLAF